MKLFQPVIIVVVVSGFLVPSTAKVILRRNLGLKSNPKTGEARD